MEIDLKELSNELMNAAGNLRFAGIVALTRVAMKIRLDLIDKMKGNFDRPTPTALRSVRYEKANEKDAEPFALVGYIQGNGFVSQHWTVPEIEGGGRFQKPSEKALQRDYAGRDILSGPYKFLVPASTAKLNKYGAFSGSTMSKVVSDIRGNQSSGYQSKTKEGKVKYFAKKSRSGTPIVYEKRGQRLVPMLVAVSTVHYAKRLPFWETVEKSYDENMQTEYDKAIRQAFTGGFGSRR